MTDKLREAAQQALEALKETSVECAIEILDAALAQQDAQAESPIIRQNKLLADALASCILASGIVRKDIDGLTGPQLLLFAEDLREMLETKKAQQDAQAVQHKFLANGTRFKMSFFQNEDGNGNAQPGTHVTCFEAFEDELDGRWVALVPAEDGCHLNAAPTPPAQQALIAAAALLSEFVEDGKPIQRKDARDVLGQLRKARAAQPQQDAQAEQPAEQPAEQVPVGYWDGEFSKDGCATLYEVPQVSAFGHQYRNVPLYPAPQPVIPPAQEKQS